jgi:hypothetical protein
MQDKQIAFKVITAETVHEKRDCKTERASVHAG